MKRMSKIIRADFKKKLAQILISESVDEWHKIHPGNINVLFSEGKFYFNITKIRKINSTIKDLTREEAEQYYIRKHKKKTK